MQIIQTPSPNFNERTSPIDCIILHYTDMLSAKDALKCLTHPTSQVSSHYLIDGEGTVFSLVEEEKRAWHAGKSFWKKCTDINSCSIGIELANPGHSHGYRPFPKAQIDSAITFCQDIQKRWNICPSRILGHSDIAPDRKQDPGHLFPWKTLAERGVGLWPAKERPPSSFNLTKVLGEIGYDTSNLSSATLAFQRRFQPHKLDGKADAETFSLLQGLLEAQKRLI